MNSSLRVQTNQGLQPLSKLTALGSTSFEDITAAAVPVAPEWQGKCIRFAGACVVTVPANLPMPFDFAWSQEGDGQVTFQAASGVTIESADSAKKSSGKFAMGGMSVWRANVVRLYGSIAV